jgi:hypothetical protein
LGSHLNIRHFFGILIEMTLLLCSINLDYSRVEVAADVVARSEATR